LTEFRIIYALILTVKELLHKQREKEFVSGAPLPLTDGVIRLMGRMYFLTVKLSSDLYVSIIAIKPEKLLEPKQMIG